MRTVVAEFDVPDALATLSLLLSSVTFPHGGVAKELGAWGDWITRHMTKTCIAQTQEVLVSSLSDANGNGCAVKVSNPEPACAGELNTFCESLLDARKKDPWNPNLEHLLTRFKEVQVEVNGKLKRVEYMKLYSDFTLEKLADAHRLTVDDWYVPGVKTITKHILLALKEMHEMGFVHRDVKPENIVFDGDKAVLIDMDIVLPLGVERVLTGGTPGYMGAEAFGDTVTSGIDIHGLGKTLIYLLIGWVHESDWDKMCAGNYPTVEEDPLWHGDVDAFLEQVKERAGFHERWSPELTDFLRKIFVARFSAAELLEHAWLKDCPDTLDEMMFITVNEHMNSLNPYREEDGPVKPIELKEEAGGYLEYKDRRGRLARLWGFLFNPNPDEIENFVRETLSKR